MRSFDFPRLRGIALAAATSMVVAAGTAASPAAAQTKVTFGTNWLAEAEHGGFYQAVAKGIYQKHGLDVTIRMGGPQINTEQVIAGGVVDFQMSASTAEALNLANHDIPVVAVAALMQKDPQCLLSHPGAGSDTIAAMKGKPIMIAAAARVGYWQFLVAKFGFTDDMIRPYNYSMAPFIADKTAIQQSYITSEPFQIEKESKEKPVINLLADNGYPSYSNIILVQKKMVDAKPDVVQAFIDASIEGWYDYLYGDPSPANALIKKDNPEMTQDVIDNSIKLIKEYGLADSGDAATLGLGAMTEARWKEFADIYIKAGIYPASLDYKKAFTAQFVNKKHAIEMRKAG